MTILENLIKYLVDLETTSKRHAYLNEVFTAQAILAFSNEFKLSNAITSNPLLENLSKFNLFLLGKDSKKNSLITLAAGNLSLVLDMLTFHFEIKKNDNKFKVYPLIAIINDQDANGHTLLHHLVNNKNSHQSLLQVEILGYLFENFSFALNPFIENNDNKIPAELLNFNIEDPSCHLEKFKILIHNHCFIGSNIHLALNYSERAYIVSLTNAVTLDNSLMLNTSIIINYTDMLSMLGSNCKIYWCEGKENDCIKESSQYILSSDHAQKWHLSQINSDGNSLCDNLLEQLPMVTQLLDNEPLSDSIIRQIEVEIRHHHISTNIHNSEQMILNILKYRIAQMTHQLKNRDNVILSIFNIINLYDFLTVNKSRPTTDSQDESQILSFSEKLPTIFASFDEISEKLNHIIEDITLLQLEIRQRYHVQQYLNIQKLMHDFALPCNFLLTCFCIGSFIALLTVSLKSNVFESYEASSHATSYQSETSYIHPRAEHPVAEFFSLMGLCATAIFSLVCLVFIPINYYSRRLFNRSPYTLTFDNTTLNHQYVYVLHQLIVYLQQNKIYFKNIESYDEIINYNSIDDFNRTEALTLLKLLTQAHEQVKSKLDEYSNLTSLPMMSTTNYPGTFFSALRDKYPFGDSEVDITMTDLQTASSPMIELDSIDEQVEVTESARLLV